ncbi:hypothetical protein EUGRSUZ_J02339 [Eucalyptus grandis]|uniref:Uncharacterized protein n=2 Tax=Eucalyptus grandis TaxID=71139 RepID=A0ACC3J7W3_EUCGR|nr:hypothetical protein EUGRSUZ_J02339 [Eucalyptus grandis]
MLRAHGFLQSYYHFCDSIIKPLGSIYKITEQYVIMSSSMNLSAIFPDKNTTYKITEQNVRKQSEHTQLYIWTTPTLILHQIKPIICT